MPVSPVSNGPARGKLRHKTTKAAAAVLILITAAVLLILCGFLLFRPQYLTIRNSKTGWLYAAYPCPDGTGFTVEFIHSVNLSPVIDHFAAEDGIIHATMAEYYTFGAGMPTQLNEGEKLESGPDGSIRITGLSYTYESLNYIVGTVYDHILTFNGEKINLTQLCGKNAFVEISLSKGLLR